MELLLRLEYQSVEVVLDVVADVVAGTGTVEQEHFGDRVVVEQDRHVERREAVVVHGVDVRDGVLAEEVPELVLLVVLDALEER